MERTETVVLVEKALRETEVWFVEHGLPSFARRPVPRSAAKVAGLFMLVAVLEAVVVAPSAALPWWADLFSVLVVGVGTAVAVSAGVRAEQRVAGRAFSRYLSEAVFVLVPAALALVLAGTLQAAVFVVVNSVALGAVAAEQRWRPLAVARCCFVHAAGQVRSATRHLSRSVPLLTVLVLSLFYTTEVWQASADMRNANLVAVVGILGAAGVVFSVVQLKSGLTRQIHVMDKVEQLRGTPAENLSHGDAAEIPLSRGEDLNVNALLVASQLCIVAVTAVAFSALIVLFGSIAITPGVIQVWTGHTPGVLASFDWGVKVCVTRELLALGALMAGVSSLVFAVSLTGDEKFQDLTRDELSGALTAAFAARNVYLAALHKTTAP